MSYATDPYQEQATPSSQSSGCLFLFLLPPLVVALLGWLAFDPAQVALTAPLPSPTSPPEPTATVIIQQDDEADGEERQQPASVSLDAEGGLASLFTPEVLYWEAKILSWSAQHDLDPNLVATVMQIESCGDPQATSRAGAMGLFQVMPYHFAAGENGYQPGKNAQRGLSYLRQALQKGGSVRMALAGYNGGITGAARGEAYWPAETQRYVYWGMGIYRAARRGDAHSARLQEWLASGGNSLCRQAASRLEN